MGIIEHQKQAGWVHVRVLDGGFQPPSVQRKTGIEDSVCKEKGVGGGPGGGGRLTGIDIYKNGRWRPFWKAAS